MIRTGLFPPVLIIRLKSCFSLKAPVSAGARSLVGNRQGAPRRIAARALGGIGTEATRRDKAVEPTAAVVHIGPSVDGKIDDHERACGQFLVQICPLVDVPGGYELIGKVLQRRIVTNDHQRMSFGLCFLQYGKNSGRIRLVNPLLEGRGGVIGKRLVNRLPGVAGALRGRADHLVGQKMVFRHIGPNPRGRLFAAWIERAGVIRNPEDSPIGFRMAKQDETAH